MRALALLLIMAVACGGGGDEPKPAAPPPKPAAPPGRPGAGSGSGMGKPLPLMRHAEDRVVCPIPNKGSPKCDPNAQKPAALDGQTVKRKDGDLWCEDGEVCQNTQDGYLCGACPEKFAIRRELKDSDFAPTNRDPFTPSVGRLPGQGTGSGSADTALRNPSSRCPRDPKNREVVRVSNYGFQDLKLVGIVAQGTQRKVLLMDPGNYGHIIKRGDCVGKEKAWVREIGDNFVCFEPSGDAALTARGPKEHCPELRTEKINLTSIPDDSPDPSRISTTPVLPPTVNRPATGSGSAAPGAVEQPPTVIRP